MIRISKFIADCGIASRREAEKLIINKDVSINGCIIESPVCFVDGTEDIVVKGKKIYKNTDVKLYAFHKPLNTVTTTYDPKGRKTIYDILGDKYKNLKYVGRLDYKTTGLLLLTNSGDFARKLTMPSSNISRTYIVTVNKYDEENLNIARHGVTIEGISYRPMDIKIIDKNNVKVTVTEGKKNEIRIVFQHINAPVRKLHRISYGPISIEKIPVGKIIEISKKNIDLLLKNF